MKGISTIFSTLIVTIVVLSFFVPLLLYYSTLNNQNQNIILSLINQGKEKLDTKIILIKLNNNSNQIFIYNYGKIYAYISEIIINNNTYTTNYTLPPDTLIRLSDIIGNITIPMNQNIIMKINDNYYIF
ncbi:MAG: hypothetical protein QXV69_04270 [Sulfolobaceae archaeon]